MVVNCPGCTAPLRFEHVGSWARACKACEALVLRDGTRYPAGADQMTLVEDLAPVRVGDVGKLNGAYFMVTGRVRAEGQRGYRNFWSLKGDIAYTWLLQAVGNYALVNVSDPVVPVSVFRNVAPGRPLKLDGDLELEVLDNRFRFAWEGELMHPLPLPWTIEMEAGDPDGGRALLLVDSTGVAQMLKGIGPEFVELGLEDPAPLARWT